MTYLDELGIPYVPSTTSGLVATLKGPHSSDHIIGIRADIDALPIKEETGAPYASEKKGLCMPAAMIRILRSSLARLRSLRP